MTKNLGRRDPREIVEEVGHSDPRSMTVTSRESIPSGVLTLLSSPSSCARDGARQRRSADSSLTEIRATTPFEARSTALKPKEASRKCSPLS
jgi:hypothetical protein